MRSTHPRRLRRCLLWTALATLTVAASAEARTLYVSPAGSGDCSTASQRCTLSTGLTQATNGDVVRLDFGTYAVPAAGLQTPTGVTVSGASAGGTILNGSNGTGTGAITVGQSGMLTDMRVNAPAGDGVHFLNGSEGDRLDVRAHNDACVPDLYPVTITNSVCSADATGSFNANALHAAYAPAFAAGITLRNVTLVADQQPVVIDFSHGGLASLSNTIAYARNPTSPDCSVRLTAASGTMLTFSSDHSNYPAITQGAGGCGGTAATVMISETALQTTRPTFADAAGAPATADLREIASSPTRAAGITDAANGASDLDGRPRQSIDNRTDIGAYQFYDPPTVTPQPVTGLSATTATLNGLVNNHGTDSSTTITYGTTASNDVILDAHNQTPAFTDQPVSDSLTGLIPGTRYLFQVCSTAFVSDICTEDRSFATPPLAPVLTGGSASAITQTAATLNGSVNTGNGATAAYFEFGPTAAYGASTAVVELVPSLVAQPLVLAAAGLTPGTVYHARLVASNSASTATGGDFTFTTSAATGPGPGGGSGPPRKGGGGPPAGHFTVQSATVSKGVVTISVHVPAAGALRASAGFTPATRRHAGRKPKRARPSLYGASRAASAAVGTVRLIVKPTAASRKALRTARKLKLTITVSFTPRVGAVSSRTITITVRR